MWSFLIVSDCGREELSRLRFDTPREAAKVAGEYAATCAENDDFPLVQVVRVPN